MTDEERDIDYILDEEEWDARTRQDDRVDAQAKDDPWEEYALLSPLLQWEADGNR